MESKQTQGTMLMIGALSGTVGLVGFVVMMVLGEMGFSAAFLIATTVALVVAVVLLIGFHRKPQRPGAASSAPAAGKAPASSARPAVSTPAPAPAASPAPAATGEAAKPATMSAARGGKPDDLKKIKGVGPKLEELLHSMGFYHYDQIAAWSGNEVAWVDDNLEGFKGRVTRDDWVTQAKTLAAGGDTEFSQKVDKGGVY